MCLVLLSTLLCKRSLHLHPLSCVCVHESWLSCVCVHESWLSCVCVHGRYVEAVRAFNAMLLTIARTRQFHEASPYFDQVMKKNEQLLALLAVSLALSPGSTSLVEEGVMGQVGETA